MKSLLTFSALLLSSATFASNIPTSSTVSLCTLHFSKVAYDKEVRSVTAHTGVASCDTYSPVVTYWSDVQDVLLDGSQSDQAFTGKVRLEAESRAYDGCRLTPVVQFWVSFADGSSKIENVTPMQISKAWQLFDGDPSELREAVKQWSQNQAINTVSCISLKGPVYQPQEVVDSLLK